MKKILAVLLSLTFLFSTGVVALAESTEKSSEKSISQLALEEIDPTLGKVVDQEIKVEGEETIIITTYEQSLGRSDTSKVFSKTLSHFVNGETSLSYKVSATFFYNKVDNTCYARNEKGEITYNRNNNWKISGEKTSTSSGGGLLSKKWASATYTFTKTNFIGTSSSNSVTVKVDSSGTKI